MHDISAFSQFIIPSVYFGLAIFMVHGMPLLLLFLTVLGGGIALLHLFSGAFALKEQDDQIGSQVLVTYGYAQEMTETEEFTMSVVLAFRKAIANVKHRIKEFHRKYIKFIAAS